VAKDLSLDQKPDLPTERQRVVKMGGFVSDESEEEGPARVWLTRSMDSCGLSMARSLGDHALARVRDAVRARICVCVSLSLSLLLLLLASFSRTFPKHTYSDQ